jgi:hypothetical protein
VRWIAALEHDLGLVVTLDDATGEIYSALLVDQEGTMSGFLGLAETISEHGLFGALYTDRGGHYFMTRERLCLECAPSGASGGCQAQRPPRSRQGARRAP